jgi:hypothetical protein
MKEECFCRGVGLSDLALFFLVDWCCLILLSEVRLSEIPKPPVAAHGGNGSTTERMLLLGKERADRFRPLLASGWNSAEILNGPRPLSFRKQFRFH